MTISAEYDAALIILGFLKVSLSLNLVQWFFTCMLLLPAVDTHYPNMVKIEIVLVQTKTPQIANKCFRPVHSTYTQHDYAMLQHAFSVTSHRKPET